MPWRVKDVMEQRIELVVRAVQGEESISGLCREYGVSRPTGYLWVQRYGEAGSVQGLAERSRRPQHSPGRTPIEQEERVVELRRRYGWGAKKLVVLLAREGIALRVVTVNRILKRRGLLVAQECHRPATQRFEREAPNQLWQMDFKGPRGWPQPVGPLPVGRAGSRPRPRGDDARAATSFGTLARQINRALCRPT